MKAKFTSVLAVLFITFGSVTLDVSAKSKYCDQIQLLAESKKIETFSVPFSSPEPGMLVYEFSLKKSSRFDTLEVVCGHSAGAECEMKLSMNGRIVKTFYEQNNFRFIKYKNKYFLVWGVSYSGGKPQIHELRVVRLKENNNQYICGIN